MSGGTTILAGLRQATGNRTEISYSPDAADLTGADAVLAVVGEQPYAEMKGDRKDLNLAPDDAALIERARRSGTPVVTVLLSGRPLILGSALENSNAFIAAWLPGTEGRGVADVLFGTAKPVGKLPRTWPRTAAQIGAPVGKAATADVLFPYGFGLSY
jgi:beta-glucosidase